jgi:hypothetical protein
MAHTLKIFYGTVETIDLNAGVYTVMHYLPRDSGGRSTVTETARIRIISDSASNLVSEIRAIDKAFKLAQRRRLTGTGDRIYIHFQESGGAVTYRSELWADNPSDMPGRVQIMDPTLNEQIITKFVAVLQLTWIRKGYWEGASETLLLIGNGTGSSTGWINLENVHPAAVFTGTTVSFTAPDTISDSGSGFGIFNIGDVISLRGSTSNDGVYTVLTKAAGAITVNEPVVTEAAGDTVNIYDITNYAHIDSSVIGGTMPAGVRIEMKNTDAGADLQTVWMGVNYLSSPDTFAHLLEIEDSDTGSNTADAGASSGQYRAYTVTTTEAKMTAWTISSETLTAANSAYFRVIARFFDGTDITNSKLRLKIFYSSQLLYEGPQVEYDDTYAGISRLWREIDSVQLPPFLLEGNTPTDLTFELWGVSTSGGNITLNVDCLVLLPVNQYRKLESSSGVAQNSILIHDSILGIDYQTVSSEHVQDITVEGSPILIWPNVDNRIYFLQHSETTDTADVDRDMDVRIYYRLRRTTL